MGDKWIENLRRRIAETDDQTLIRVACLLSDPQLAKLAQLMDNRPTEAV